MASYGYISGQYELVVPMSPIYSVLQLNCRHVFTEVDNENLLFYQLLFIKFSSLYRKINKETPYLLDYITYCIFHSMRKMRSFLIYFLIWSGKRSEKGIFQRHIFFLPMTNYCNIWMLLHSINMKRHHYFILSSTVAIWHQFIK